MKISPLTFVWISSFLWIVKSFVYWLFFRLRQIPATVLSCLIIAGAPTLAGIVPLSFPLSLLLGIGLAAYLIARYTEVDFFPTGFFLALVVELVFFLVTGLAMGQIVWG